MEKVKRKRKYKFTSEVMTSCFQAVITSTI